MAAFVDIIPPEAPDAVLPSILGVGALSTGVLLVLAIILLLVLIAAWAFYTHRQSIIALLRLKRIERSRQSLKTKVALLFDLMQRHQAAMASDQAKQPNWRSFHQQLSRWRFGPVPINEPDWQDLVQQSRYWLKRLR